MLRKFKRFAEEEFRGQKLDRFMTEMNQSLDELISGKATKDQVEEFIHSLLQTQDEEGFWAIIPSPNVDSDFRVAYWYMPTYIASAFLMHYYLHNENTVDVEAALIRGLQASKGRGLNGHGHDHILGRIEAVEVFKKGSVLNFLEQYPHLVPDFATLFFSVMEGFSNALATGQTKGDWGEEYKEEMERALAGFKQDDGTLIFVYGTLLKGRSNHQRYLSTARFICEGMIHNYTLYDLGYYPGVKHSKKGVVRGEVYKVDAQTLKEIDMLEGEGSLFLRETTKVSSGPQIFHCVSVYVYNQRTPKNKLIPFEAQPWGKKQEKEYVWYAGFGSNLLYERFMSYIEGGTSRFNHKSYPGCTDKTPPKESLPLSIPYKMYFGNKSGSWSNAGVSFLDISTEAKTLGKMYLITKEQFDEVRIQEGSSDNWYNHVIQLGEHDGIKIFTITNCNKRPEYAPADNYLDVLRNGLKESYPTMSDFEIMKYLVACGPK